MSEYKVNITGLNTGSLKSWSSEKTLNAIKEYKEGKIPIDDIVINNLKLVLSCIQEFKNNKDNMDDMFSNGVLGLIKAINNFDLNRTVMFSTYAVPMIKGEVRRYIRECQNIVKISRKIKDLAYNVIAIQDDYLQKNGTLPSIEYLEKTLDAKGYEIKEALDSLSPTLSLDDPINSDEDMILSDVIPSDKDYVANYRDMISLKEGIENLDCLEKEIIDKRYYQDMTQMEVAKDLDISQAQVSRIEKSALKSLRKYFTYGGNDEKRNSS